MKHWPIVLRPGWESDRLGRGVPIARGLRRWWRVAWILFGVATIGVAVWLWTAYNGGIGQPISPSAAEEEARKRLAATDLPRWDPGAELPPVAMPDVLSSPEAPFARGSHPG
ncbi:MAG: hypothetical protein AAGE94_05025, partial [Acidobacteriota bacterium]